MKLITALKLLTKIEQIDTRNEKPKSLKGFQPRTIILLLGILEDEGGNQTYYKDKFGWTKGSTSVHTNTLLDHGFIIYAEDERDTNRMSKRLYLADGVEEYLLELLGLENK